MRYLAIALLISIFVLTGCNTTTFYDEKGNVIRVERFSDFSRAMDGTNQKSQLVLLNGRYLKFELSATAGENSSPGLNTKFISGKAAIVNLKDNADFTGLQSVIEEFLTENISVNAGGINIGKSAGDAAASGNNINQKTKEENTAK